VRVRDEFLSVAAHELKTPLTSLRGFAQLGVRQLDANGRLDPAMARLALEGIDRQSDKLGRLVSRLLEVSRFDAGQFSLHREDTDLVRLVTEVIQAARARAPRHEIELRAPPSAVVQVDPVRIDQIVTNLLDNAIRYSPQDRPIALELSTPTPDTIRLAVRDHGRGIDAEHRDRVFDRFFQAHARDHASGMGLGLYISRQLARAHGGDLRAEFPEDGGTRFVLTLPRGEGRGARG
jgi:signal transduction histidine kinase